MRFVTSLLLVLAIALSAVVTVVETKRCNWGEVAANGIAFVALVAVWFRLYG
jgi:hypothetical protein